MSRPFSLNLTRTTFNYQDNTWSGVRSDPIFSPKISTGQLVVNALGSAPYNVGQICHEDGHEMRNFQILQASVRVALNLRDLGLKEGDVLGFAAGNSRHVAPVVFGALLNGIPVSTLDPTFEFGDVKHIFGITLPKIVVCDEVNYEHVKRALSELDNPSKIYVFDGEEEKSDVEWTSVRELLNPHPNEATFVAPTLSDCEKLPALIVCSSGSTGSPKTIPISHAFLNYMYQATIALPSNSRMFSFSTMYWMSGISSLLMSTMARHVRVIVKKPFNAKLFLEIVKTRQLNLFICTPAQLQLLLLEEFNHDDLKSLIGLFCGGSAVPDFLHTKFKVPVIGGYGLTEGGPVAIGGQLMAGTVVKIVDDSGKKLGVGERGEICLKPMMPFLGYLRNEAATKEMQIGEFLHTGDIGLFDENGNLHVVDRKKEIFKYNNFHINPTDVEKELQKLDGVALVSVVGIPHAIYACLPAALIIRKEGSKLTENEVHEFAKANLPHYKFLRGGVYFVDELPMTVSGKIIRRHTTKKATEMFEIKPDIGFQY